MSLGKQRRKGIARLLGGILYYLALVVVSPVLLLLVAGWFLVDVTVQIGTNREGLRDDGFVPRLYKKSQGTANWAFFGSDDERFGRR